MSTYGLLVGVAAFSAGWVLVRGFRERGLDGDAAWSLLIYGLIGGFAGAKPTTSCSMVIPPHCCPAAAFRGVPRPRRRERCESSSG